MFCSKKLQPRPDCAIKTHDYFSYFTVSSFIVTLNCLVGSSYRKYKLSSVEAQHFLFLPTFSCPDFVHTLLCTEMGDFWKNHSGNNTGHEIIFCRAFSCSLSVAWLGEDCFVQWDSSLYNCITALSALFLFSLKTIKHDSRIYFLLKAVLALKSPSC